MTTQSQNTMVRKQLEAGGAITPIDALNWFGIMRLGARIYDLRQSGLSIKTEIIHKGHKHFARYTLLRSEILETGDYDIHIKMKPNRTIKGTLITGKEDNRNYSEEFIGWMLQNVEHIPYSDKNYIIGSGIDNMSLNELYKYWKTEIKDR